MRLSTSLLLADMLSSRDRYTPCRPTAKQKEDILKEYDLIQTKESDLSANERRKLVHYVEKQGW